ncbi:CheA signal transduction histidine kinase [Halothece sp. PCC 7418]|uniref:hybrid sensor histidine kinase/response regulator n=1 Tax=Halothece sp. (strain PCC 7418) TaxID=65093 RepID=UPI0002A06263|nr:hybrid sensor histidine kinase/response regulator [Halothece sp. PCC 7418]AFZ43215.1 CheA signal transduction histidine kinase [Halothece sp. PCC 7418]
MIEDEELRVIYQSTSQEHLQQLEEGILNLEKNPSDLSALSELMREAHSLKGDSRILDLTEIEQLTHKVEDILGAVNRQEIIMTPELSDHLYQTLDAIAQLVETATSDAPSNIDANALLQQLDQLLNDPPSAESVEEIEDIAADAKDTLEFELEATFDLEDESIEESPSSDAIDSPEESPEENTDSSLMIADEELRGLYQNSSREHLQSLKTHLQEYARQPEDQNILEKLLKEAENLKTDSIIVGLEGTERLSEALEDIFDQLVCQDLPYSPELLDRVEYVVAELEKLITEALEGVPSGVNIDRAIAELRADKWRYPENKPNTTESNGEQPKPSSSHTNGNGATHKAQTESSTPPKADDTKEQKPYRIDTIRVQTQHLDSLMTQTGELTVTKIRIAHTANQLEELFSLWEDWKNKHNKQLQDDDKDSDFARMEELITHLRDASQENSTRLDMIAGDLEEKIGTLRLLPLSTVFHLFPRMVRDLAREENKEVELILEGGETTADKQILEEIKDPLMHLIRNAVDHGLETPEEREAMGKSTTGKIELRAYQTGSNIVIELADDGRGLDIQKIKQTAIKRGLYHPEELDAMSTNQLYSLILTPGFSTRSFITEVSGRGVGLDVVQTNVQRLKGNIQIDSTPGEGCTFKIQLGTTLATANVLLVDLQNTTYGLPVEAVQTSFLVSPDEIFTIEGRSTISLDNQAVSVARLSELLELPENHQNQDTHQQLPCILLNIGEEKFGLFVDQLLDTQDVVIKPQSKILKRVRNVLGATILGTGEVCMILNPQDLLKSLQQKTTSAIHQSSKKAQPLYQETTKPVVLLAEDSITVRTQEKRILEGAGYEVVTAVDGLDGYNKLKTRHFDAIVSDVQMPNIDGLTFAEKVREEQEYTETPFILVTSLNSDEDKRRGAKAGANAYITKDKFNQELLIDTLGRLV